MVEQFPMDELFEHIANVSREHPLWRYGEVIWWVLLERWPDLASEVQGDEHFDPFYHDDGVVIDRLITWLTNKEIGE